MAQEAEELPGYQRGEPIHDSSASAVYRARRSADGAAVVVKRSLGSAVSARQLTRYRNEYELLRSLNSDRIVKVYDLVRHDGQIALILQDLPGSSLRRWLESHVTASLEERLRIAVQLAAIVADVHAANIIHKDISSHNFVYDTDSGRCNLIDFGIATRLRTEENKFQAPASLEGTLAYIAPEQTGRMNRSFDYRADLYSLGVTLYELFTGVLPHDSADPLEMVHFHIAGKPVRPSARGSAVPEAVSNIVMKLLQKEPENRYQSATGLQADLEVCLAAVREGRPLETFALGTCDAVDRFEPPQKLYGRTAEHKVLLTSFERVARGGVETVMVAGQAGIGKTSLVQEIHQPITRQRGYFVAGKFDQLQQNVPFSAVVTALQDLVQQLLTESEEAIGRWRSTIQAAVQPNGQLIVDVVPALELIIGPQPKVPELEPFEAQNRFNLVFQNFVQVFCKRAHPLVLFLDDMQWADAASLNLVTLIVSARATESLLLVMTYRDNEVSATHPFMLAIKEQAKQGVQIHSIDLKPLGAPQIAEFVADALHQDVATAAPLAEIIAQKTGGNPFFMRQFLHALYASKLIFFDPKEGVFRCDASAVKSAAITENVAEFLAAKIEKLPRATRDVLRVAAAIGNRFELRVLAGVEHRSAAETATHLRPALEDGLIVPMSGLETLDYEGLESPLVYARFAFLHDRVQQAAYATLSAADKPALHLAIGRVLLDGAPPTQLEGRLFDIVNHLNQATALIADEKERQRLAELNLRAGAKARDATAYELAVRCFRYAVALLGDHAWRNHYAIMCDAHKRLAETLGLTADYPGAFNAIDAALEHATSIIDRANLYTIKTNVLLIMGRIPEALACGRQAARMFDVDLPEDRERVRALLQTETEVILARTAAIGIDKLLDLPAMEDGGKIALMALLTHCLPAAYQTDQDSYALLTCTMVRLSLEFGNCPLSARAYGSFAALISSGLRRYKDAYRFAKLGVDLAHKGEPSVLSGVYFLWAMFASHWNKPIDESIELYRQSIQYGLQTGDHLHAGYSVARRFSHLQFRGTPLAELREDGAATMEMLQRIGDETNTEFVLPRLRFVDWLEGHRHHGNTLATDERDETAWTAIIQARGNRSFESDWFRQLAIHRYYSGDFAASYEFGKISQSLLPFSAGFVTRAEHAMFFSLAITALYPQASQEQRAVYDAELGVNREQLAISADNCPENYLHMQLLVEAECARVAGARMQAADLYDRALTAAREQSFVNIEALAAELAARFWLADNKADFARLYLDKALHAYEIWGATGKAADLRAAHGISAPRSAAASVTAGSTTIGGSTERSDALDLATVLKASQAIAGEIVLDRLLATLMDIIVENAGAESAVLVLESDGEYLVQGVKNASSRARVMMAEPLRESVALSKGIVNYVMRTSEHVVLADPALRGNFRTDPYVANRHPKSVLCAPVAHKGKLTGIIYLENNQVAGAFTPDRLEALNILMSQIAVSIENATLYAKQEQQTRAIEAANVTLTKEIAERRRAEMELSRYKDHLEDLVTERTKELESAQGRLVDLSRRAGMAEVASGVLHNVGNVMNSVNVGASVARDAVKALPVEGVTRACDLIDQNAARLAEYLKADPTGRKIPEYLRKLGAALAQEKAGILAKIDQLSEHLEHMKQIIAAQQSYAKVNGVTEVCTLEEIAETALSISEGVLRNSNIDVVRDYEKLPAVLIDRHRIMQILVNLISNAKHALEEQPKEHRELRVAIAKVEGGARIEVRDNGVGISRENLAKVFNHGFTTKKKGHGFGLHNCANAAQQMDGSLTAYSDGPGKGASFVLRIPVEYADELPLKAGFMHARVSE